MQTYLSAQSLFLKLNFASNSSNTTKCRYETFFVLLNFTGFLRFVIMIMKMMNCFCGMVDRRKVYSLISSRDHCQRSSPSGISVAPRAGSEPAQSLSSSFHEWSCAVVTTVTHGAKYFVRDCLSKQMFGHS